MDKEKFEAYLTSLEDDDHKRVIDQDYTGNTGCYRIASHGAAYCYVSDYYGIAMQSFAVSDFSDADLKLLSEGLSVPRPE